MARVRGREDYPMRNISSCLCAIEQNADKILIVYDQITPKVVVSSKQLEYELDAFMHEVTLSYTEYVLIDLWRLLHSNGWRCVVEVGYCRR